MVKKPSKSEAEESCSIDSSVIEMESGFGFGNLSGIALQENNDFDTEDLDVVGESDPFKDTDKEVYAVCIDGPNPADDIPGTSAMPAPERESTRESEIMVLQAGNVEPSQSPEVRLKKKKGKERKKNIFFGFSLALVFGVALASFIVSIRVEYGADLRSKKQLASLAIRMARMQELQEDTEILQFLMEDRVNYFCQTMQDEVEKFTTWFNTFCQRSYEGKCFTVKRVTLDVCHLRTENLCGDDKLVNGDSINRKQMEYIASEIGWNYPYVDRRRRRRNLSDMPMVFGHERNSRIYSTRNTRNTRNTRYIGISFMRFCTTDHRARRRTFQVECEKIVHQQYHSKKIGRHDIGLCDTCMVPETVEHFLLHCNKYEHERHHLKKKAKELKVNFDIFELLCDPRIISFVIEFVLTTGRRM